jgi:hypothetical protein
MPCPFGAFCSSKGDKQPTAAFGHWTSYSIDKLTFIPCLPAFSCVGGQTKSDPVDLGCAAGFTGRRCECEDGYYKLEFECVKCAEVNHLLFAIFGYCVPLLLMICLVYFTFRLRISPTAIGVLVTFARTLATFQNFDLGWPGSSNGAMTARSAFNLNVDLLSVESYIPNPRFVDKW